MVERLAVNEDVPGSSPGRGAEMNNTNFGKDVRKLNEEELFQIINNSDPSFGVLSQYELLRRLALKNEESSERFAKSSLYLAIVAIIVSIGIGTVQIYLATI